MAIPVYDQELDKLLRTTKISALINEHPIIAVKKSELVPTAFKAMIDNQILSLPVFDETENQVGFIDIIDILHFVLKIDQEVIRKGYDELTRYEEFKYKKVADLVNLSGRNATLKITQEASLWTAMNAMVDFGDLHRVPIVNRSGETLGLIAQIDIIKFIQKFIDENDYGLFTVRDFQLGFKNAVARISKDAKAKDAFKLMKELGVSAVAVVTDQDKLYANLSATDLRSIGYDTALFGKVMDSVESYLKLIPPNKVFGVNPVFVRPADDLRQVFRKFVDSGVHRLYVVEDVFNIVGVISLVDVIRLILRSCDERSIASPPREATPTPNKDSGQSMPLSNLTPVAHVGSGSGHH
jgi:CBS domain-containing protein